MYAHLFLHSILQHQRQAYYEHNDSFKGNSTDNNQPTHKRSVEMDCKQTAAHGKNTCTCPLHILSNRTKDNLHWIIIERQFTQSTIILTIAPIVLPHCIWRKVHFTASIYIHEKTIYSIQLNIHNTLQICREMCNQQKTTTTYTQKNVNYIWRQQEQHIHTITNYTKISLPPNDMVK